LIARDEREPTVYGWLASYLRLNIGNFLRNQQGSLETVDLKGLPDSFIDYYTRFGTTIDPARICN